MRLVGHRWRVLRVVLSPPFGRALHAEELEPQTAQAIEDAVEVRLVDDLSLKDRKPAFRLHLHPLEGLSVPLAELASHHYPVNFPGVLMHPASPDRRHSLLPPTYVTGGPAVLTHRGISPR